ncbi:MAG TPA: hypothetical protein VFV62_01795 [Gaiellaceae bacterium]|nr:hypothetical protein [Gaiellaceae bacterium]
MRRIVLAPFVGALVLAVAGSAAGPPADHAALTLSILPPGENGSVAFDRNTTRRSSTTR